jgi:hypothetical protein
MARKRKKLRQPQRLGAIDANSIYPVVVFLRKLGICRNSLSAMRRQGLPVREINARRLAVDGAEAVAWFRSQWQSKEGTPVAEAGD